MMTLAEYLTRENLTQSAFAALLGTTDATVSRWVAGRSMPRPDAIRRIERATGGKVPAASWFEASMPDDRQSPVSAALAAKALADDAGVACPPDLFGMVPADRQPPVNPAAEDAA